MKPRSFSEEHERAKRIQSAVLPHTGECPPLVPVAHNYSGILARADSHVAECLEHDRQGVALDVNEESLTAEMAQQRVDARITVQASTAGKRNSAILPEMGYKRLMDYDSGLVRRPADDAPNPPPSGEAPPSP